jgi:hypothetical protein
MLVRAHRAEDDTASPVSAARYITDPPRVDEDEAALLITALSGLRREDPRASA